MRTPTKILLLALAAAGPLRARAGSLVLTYAQSVYIDGKDAPLRAPEGVACDDAGALWVADTGNARLVRFAFQDGSIGAGAEVKAPQIVQPVRVQIEPGGTVLVLDRKGNRLVRLDAKGAVVGAVEAKDAAGNALTPVAFRVDAGGGLWILDAGRRVVALGEGGKVVRTLDLPAPGTLFTDIAVDGAGTVYAVDAMQAKVWSAPKGATAFRALSRSLKDEMSFPAYVVAAGGKILLVDQAGHGIVVLGLDGAFLGRQLSYGAADGFVQYPTQMCLTSAGDLLLADRNNNRVDQFTIAR